ncbi:MAG TPA: hypothetical protein VGZ93_00905, partial [Candidatus Methylacidiphilales bacterium]|nr:hypothetical protein [Candidatus Methylacidiphilales bacterium]
SKARQSVFGGFLGLSLNFVILPFFMWLRSSRGYDANDSAPHRIADEKHSAIDQPNRTKTPLIGSTEIIELDYVRVQKHLCCGSKVDSVLLPVCLFLGGAPLKVHGEPRLRIYWYSVGAARTSRIGTGFA